MIASRGIHSSLSSRAGSVLVVVLVVIVLLTLAAYTFSETMISEDHAANMFARETQARALADSAIELAAAELGNRGEVGEQNLYHNEGQFGGVTLLPGATPHSQGRYTLAAPFEHDATYRRVRFGLIDESGKLNVNAIPLLKLDETQSRQMLMYLPNMTESIADSILDWIDSDVERRSLGAEAAEYAGRTPPVTPRNGSIESLDELLQVSGVTPSMFQGEDANRNGLLDPNENDGDLSPPSDNADGALQLGWGAYLTIHSRELNLRADGSERINVNQPLLTELYDTLQADQGDAVATFVTAYRLNGATNVSPIPGQNTGVATTGDLTTDQELERIANQLAGSIAQGTAGGVTRGGMDLSRGGRTQVASLFELVDAEVVANVNGTETTLKSPWTASGGGSVTLDTLLDRMTTTSSRYIEGRVNVNQARSEALLGLPFMPTGLADSIAKQQPIGSDGLPDPNQLGSRATTGWLLTNGLVDVTTMRQLDRFLTARGDVYRAQAIGHFGAGGPVVRQEAVIDATQRPPAIVFRRDLTLLGPGYRLDELFPVESNGSGGRTSGSTQRATTR